MEPRVISPELLQEARHYAESREALARFFRDSGLSKAMTIIAFAHVTGMSPAAAKAFIHESQAWEARKAFDEAVEDAFAGQIVR